MLMFSKHKRERRKMLISIKVKTNAKKNGIKTICMNVLEVSTTATPEKGKANQCVIELLSKHFQVSKSSISIIRGANSHHKIIDITK